jgi:esterase/lipase
MKKRTNNVPILLRITRATFPFLERWMPFVSNRIFRLVFYVPLRYRVPEKEKEIEGAAKKFTITIREKKVQAYAWGETQHPYVLLVHGWAGRATQFRRFIEPLNAAGYRVVGFDGPGHGQSEGRNTSILEFEEVLQVLFKELGEPAAIITHSFGGAATLYAAMNGLPVSKLVNIASPSVPDEILKTFLRAINGSWKSALEFKKYVKKVTGKSFDEFSGLYSIQRLPRPINLMVVQDEDDTDVIYQHAVELLKVYPSAKLLKTTGLGHSRVLKDDEVIAHCVDFIKS